MLKAGQTLSHYEILEPLGEGGMGQVFRARDIRLHRDVTLKVVRPDAVSDPDHRRRFVLEARAASALNHPHIVTVYDIEVAETPDGPVEFIAMEYLTGGSLANRIGTGLPVDDVLRFGIQIANALSAAHEAGIVHRDIKPENVMLTAAGSIKVVDFGVAKLTEGQPGQITASTHEKTATGIALGTLSYMAPEQAEGRVVDGRADVFAFGVLMYEMLSGRNPFARASAAATLAAILVADVGPVNSVRADVPADVTRIVARCLAKDPEARYQSAAELQRDLEAVVARLHQRDSIGSVLRQPRVAIPAMVVLLVVIAAGAWFWIRDARIRRARIVQLPEIERLASDEEHIAALQLAEHVHGVLGDDPALVKLWERIAMPVTVRTEPPGATITMRSYSSDDDAEWIRLGESPLLNRRLPYSNVRFRIEKSGYQTAEFTSAIYAPELTFTLVPAADSADRMVKIDGGRFAVASAPAVDLNDFWIDRYEVTNREYKRFLDQGGYSRRDYWKHAFVRDGRELSWQEAMDTFHDATGRPGPATWESGTYPDGQADFPVGGVSWYEAAAYGEFAGKTLPTLFEWYKAAGLGADVAFYSEIVDVSNFSTSGPTQVGSRNAISAFGVHDMAGNVKEWCLNEATAGNRHSLGGGWGEAKYLFRDRDAHPPFARGANFGFRLARRAAEPTPETARPLVRLERDFSREQPVSDEVFRAYAALYQYLPKDLGAAVTDIDSTISPQYRRERVTFKAAYGDEEVPAWLFVPAHVPPPWQTVVYFPSGESLQYGSSETIHRDWRLEPIFKSGRALLHPIYKGTYERQVKTAAPGVPGTVTIQRYQDLARAVDYLATRRDIDTTKLAYYGISFGAGQAPIMLALERRFKVAVLLWGGLRGRHPPVADPLNFAPRVTTPVLMVNGRYDFIFPVSTGQLPLYRLLGTADVNKRHVLFDYGHIPPKNQETIREVLDWLDKYLGLVRPSGAQR